MYTYIVKLQGCYCRLEGPGNNNYRQHMWKLPAVMAAETR